MIELALIPYLPLFKEATNLTCKILEIYNTAEYNKNICEALVERVKLTENAIDSLKRKKQKNEDKFRDEEYYKAFNRFIYVLKEIKDFASEITNIRGLKKYSQANFVKENFQRLTDEYDVAMKDLHFTIAVASEEQRKIDAEALKEDLSEMSKHLEIIQKDILEEKNKIDTIHDVVTYLMNHLDKPPLHDVNKIDSKDLTSPARGKYDDMRGKNPNLVIKKIYKGQEVACKSILEETPKTQKHFEILMKLSECKYILRFYGISKIENNNVMVFEWAERGTLKQLYEKKHILWHYKVRIALEICRGLIFLQCTGILHHDTKCKNILITESLEPKIYNFELARYSDGESTSSLPIDSAGDIFPWLSPEKLNNSRYTTQSEIFSFGMLLWELGFEKVPYKGWNANRIRDHVTKGGRERISFRDSTPEISKLQEDYKKIINDTWKQNPQERISFMKSLDMLEELYNSIRCMFDNDSSILPDKSSDSDVSISDAYLELPEDDISSGIFRQVISLEEGIQAFKDNEHQKAWECFDFHAKNNNITAKYLKGRYLWEGYHDNVKEREEGKELLKEAADKGNSDAQLRYAFTLQNVLDEGDNKQMFMKYLEKAAEGNNLTAQFHLGEIYYRGKRKIPKDEKEGIKWLRKAALHDNIKATKLLSKSGINIYDI